MRSTEERPATMEELNRLWGTRRAKIVKLPDAFPRAKDPLAWACDICINDPYLVGTAMRWVFQDVTSDDTAMMYVLRGRSTDEIRRKLVDGVKRGAAVQLQVNSLGKKAPEYQRFVDEHISPALRTIYPLGWTYDIVLFATGSEHVYDAHCDVGDAFLFQLLGRKQIEAWGPAAGFWKPVIYDHDHRGKPNLFRGKKTAFELKPGDGIYFHRGMMHKISVPAGEQSVSICIRPDSVYPLLTLRDELCEKVGVADAFGLSPGSSHWDKFRAKVFDPTRFVIEKGMPQNTMPPALRDPLCQLLLPKDPVLGRALPSLLDRWWAELVVRRNHSPTGPLPAPPSDREEQLKGWEKERQPGA